MGILCSPLAAAFHGYFTPGSAVLHPWLRSDNPPGLISLAFP